MVAPPQAPGTPFDAPLLRLCAPPRRPPPGPQTVQIEGKTLRFCYDRLTSLLKTLEITASDDFGGLHAVADFATLVGTYSRGFAIITEPYDDRLPSVSEGCGEGARRGRRDSSGGGGVGPGARGRGVPRIRGSRGCLSEVVSEEACPACALWQGTAPHCGSAQAPPNLDCSSWLLLLTSSP